MGIEYKTNPRYHGDDVPVYWGVKDAAALYDSTNNEWTIQTLDEATTLTDRFKVKAGQAISQIEVYNDDPGATGILDDSFHESASPAISDILKHERIFGMDGNGTSAKAQFGGLKWTITNITDGTEEAQLEIELMKAGAVATVATVTSSAWTYVGDLIVGNGYGVVIGHPTQVTGANAAELQVLGTGGEDTGALIGRFSANTGPATLQFVKSRAAIDSFAIVEDNDEIMRLVALPDDGVDYETQAAHFIVEVEDASPAAGDIGVAFVWKQMPGGGGALRETMRLKANGNLEIKSSRTGELTALLYNSSDGGGGDDAIFYASVGGVSAGDPMLRLNIPSGEGVSFGLDNSASDRIALADGFDLGSNDRMRIVTATGVMSVDGDGGGSDDPVSLFDIYDDAVELKRFAYAYPNSIITPEQRELNRDRMVEMGVAEWSEQDDGSERLMINIQPMFRLVAGGIYQTRQLVDELASDILIRLKKIEDKVLTG